ncbi:uncharacterized protein LW94_10298 [Fusarium fujikuroi]|nr:uncharacterized protein LW94_10298 [Fusarium fujikuroi]SCO57764.1 uncharacterized protein FFMR_14920 [Fusarium fujikuroi]
MASAFHLFSALPRELRLKIWEDAIRPDLPAVHTLRLHVPGSRVLGRPQDTIHFPRRRSAYRLISQTGNCLSIPLWNKYLAVIDSDSDFNISPYLTDVGLWTACHESRLTIQKHLKNKPFQYTRFPSWKGYYISGGPPLYLTICYSNDLVILKLDRFNFRKWGRETLGRLQDMRNIGIEYRHKWAIELYEEDERGTEADVLNRIDRFCRAVYYGTRVWIIDHNLRRKVDAPPCDEKRGQDFCSCENFSFLHGADRKFSSTGLEKGGDRLAHWNI